MNFISDLQGDLTHVELKYCERCGGLFLRPRACDIAYCTACLAVLAACPQLIDEPRQQSPKRRGPRMVKGPRLREEGLQGPAHVECLQGVSAFEVRA